MSLEYNEQGQLIKEKLGNDLSLSYSYDHFGRLLSIIYPDQPKMLHLYQGQHLKEIRRVDKEGNTCYSHNYSSFDSNGKVISAQLPQKAGLLEWKFDKQGRLQTITGPGWSESIDAYDPLGNIVKRTIHSPDGSANNFDYQYNNLKPVDGRKLFASPSLSIRFFI